MGVLRESERANTSVGVLGAMVLVVGEVVVGSVGWDIERPGCRLGSLDRAKIPEQTLV